MRAGAVIGGGSTPFGKLEGMGILDLAVSACREALAESRGPPEKIQALYLGNFVGERLAGAGGLGGGGGPPPPAPSASSRASTWPATAPRASSSGWSR